jgi:hypothetical protein
MVLNVLGNAAYGVGDQGISIDGAVPAALAGILAGEPRWIGNALVIFQNNTAGGIYTYNTSTLALTAVDALGENRLGAGAGVYAAYLAGGGTPGVRTNITGFGNLPFAAIGDVTETGQVVVIPDAANYQGVSVFDATGTGLWSLSVGLAVGTQPHARVNVTAYADVASGTWHLWQNAPPLQQSFTAPTGFPVVWTVPCFVGGALYVLEQSDRLTFRQKDATSGYIITTGLSFNPDVRLLSPGVVRIGWCINAGESTDSLRLMDLIVATGVNQVAQPSAGTMVFTPGTQLVATAIPGNPTDVGGAIGGLAGLYPPLRQPVQEQNRLISKPWARWATDVGTTLQTVARNTGGPVATPPGTPSTANVVGPAASVDGEIVLYSGVTGKLLKRATGTGPVQATAGVYSVATTGFVPLKAVVPLTNAQIIALPTTPVMVVAAPASGFRVKLLASTFAVDAAAGFYTGIDATYAALVLCHDDATTGAWIAVAAVNDSSIATAPAELETFLGTPNHQAIIDLPSYLTAWSDAAVSGYVLPGQGFPDFANVTAKALVVSMDNNGAGVLGGGNVANSLRITVYYVIEQVT